MARVVIDRHGNKSYLNNLNYRHREDGPAVIWSNGIRKWFHNGLPYRVDGPYEYFGYHGVARWATDKEKDNPHRENGPAVEFPNGFKIWCYDGEDVWPVLK